MREAVEAAHHLRARTQGSMVHSGDFLLHVLNLVGAVASRTSRLTETEHHDTVAVDQHAD